MTSAVLAPRSQSCKNFCERFAAGARAFCATGKSVARLPHTTAASRRTRLPFGREGGAPRWDGLAGRPDHGTNRACGVGGTPWAMLQLTMVSTDGIR